MYLVIISLEKYFVLIIYDFDCSSLVTELQLTTYQVSCPPLFNHRNANILTHIAKVSTKVYDSKQSKISHIDINKLKP